MIEQGIFVVVEGIDGSGKTTLVKNLGRALKRLRFKVTTMRAPGGTQQGDLLRSLVVSNTNLDWTARSETFLFMVDRAEACDKLIRPSLAEKKIVVCDRFTGSTLAYQGYGRGEDIEKLAEIEAYARGGLEPDLTLYIDLPLETAIARMSARNKATDSETRFENEGERFLERVHAGYELLCEQYDWDRLDGTLDEAALTRAAMARVGATLGIDLSDIDF